MLVIVLSAALIVTSLMLAFATFSARSWEKSYEEASQKASQADYWERVAGPEGPSIVQLPSHAASQLGPMGATAIVEVFPRGEDASRPLVQLDADSPVFEARGAGRAMRYVEALPPGRFLAVVNTMGQLFFQETQWESFPQVEGSHLGRGGEVLRRIGVRAPGRKLGPQQSLVEGEVWMPPEPYEECTTPVFYGPGPWLAQRTKVVWPRLLDER